MALFKVPKKSKEEKLAQLTSAQRRQLDEIRANAKADFEGDLDELESALGMLDIGHDFGWKVLYIIHSKRTIRKYERILKIKIREIFDKRGRARQIMAMSWLCSTTSNPCRPKFLSGFLLSIRNLRIGNRKLPRLITT